MPSNVFIGVGSDEAIDSLIRAFCIPGHDRILVCPPTYGMYTVCAKVNDIVPYQIPLSLPDFTLDLPSIHAALSDQSLNIKLIYLCSPGNPTGRILDRESILSILAHPIWNGIVAVDEAYIDFAPILPSGASSSLANSVVDFPNLVVLQTLSKSFGLAGIRLGFAFAPEPIAALLNTFKAPYNVSSPTAHIAHAALKAPHIDVMRQNIRSIVGQRERLIQQLPKISGIGRFRGGFDANFLLVEILDGPVGNPSNAVALELYSRLAEKNGVIVRFRGDQYGCTGCLRITVGNADEVSRLLDEVTVILDDIYRKK